MLTIFAIKQTKESKNMICPDCDKGMINVTKNTMQQVHYGPVPCPRCNGSGIAYCCDGEDYNSVRCNQPLEEASNS